MTALADAAMVGPVGAPFLRLVGLQGTGSGIRIEQGHATSAGRTIAIVGAYADNTRTVVFLRLDPELVPALEADALSEPSGRPATIGFAMDEYGNDRGDEALTFGPLARPEPGGNRLVLRIHRLHVTSPAHPQKFIVGNWTLRFTVAADGHATLPRPAPGNLGRIEVSLSMSAVGNRIHCLVTLNGPVTDLIPLSQAAAEGSVRILLMDSAGRAVSDVGLSAGGVSFMRGSDRGVGTYHADLQAPGPGIYWVAITWNNDRFERPVTLR